MVEFRAKITVAYRALSIEHAKRIIESYLWSSDREPSDDYMSEGAIEFKHPTLGWMPVNQSGSDDEYNG